MAAPIILNKPYLRKIASLNRPLIQNTPGSIFLGLCKITATIENRVLRGYADTSHGSSRKSNRMLADANKIRQNLTPTVSETPFHMGASFGLKKKDESQTENMPSHSESEPKNKPDREKQEKNNDSSSLEEFDDTFEDPEPRLPRAVQAAYLGPLRRKVTYGIPVCDLQLRSYSVRNLEFMADVALRAAYFLDLPASGPVALPRIIERWTVPKAHFIHKKIQQNYERKTLRRLIQIKDGDSEVVRLWLGFLRKHAYYGVGMKANVWEFCGLDVAKDMDAALEQNRPEIEPLLAQYAFKKGSKLGDDLIEIVNAENRWQAYGGSAPMMSTPNWRKPLN
ncbi:Bgt-5294 [Blumeria graminis f. sp. tritici]|uniref:Small ribosomal subunit protein uS10m n=1 Tax=Blumeria graminis f. sp. tritici TaxID=62690 RepID=A0A9X9PQ47_BLUGR|nr:Bgt-5294 [Blumeria graminis f. sp. tritici]